MVCRFEDRLHRRALRLDGWVDRIEARSAADVAPALAKIEAARRAGHWLALLLHYELGEWLAPESTSPPPGCPPSAPREDNAARLTALVFEHATWEAPWPAPARAMAKAEVTPRLPRHEYLANVRHIRELIIAGELYQLNYTHLLDVRLQGSARDLYGQIAARHPVAHAAYIEDGDRTILSFSPELFVARIGTSLITRPMKGTAPRHPDPRQDRQLAQALHASPKNCAENLMIVDLLRNDLGRLATPGSVRVDDLFSLECYPTVWALTSTLSAQAPGVSLGQILAALFPCGSITGAPKIATMRRIRQLESAPRGLYCGSIGWMAPEGDFSLNVAIRTLVLDEAGRGVYGTGGGIVYDSHPAEEWEECQWKARILTT